MRWNPFSWIYSRPTAHSSNTRLGELGEKHASRYLRRQGYRVLVRRFRSRAGEIDLVCRDGEWLVFVEVKTRRGEEIATPSEAVDLAKQRHMAKVALDYLRLLHYPEVRFRFDVVEVIWPAGTPKPETMRLIRDAFEMPEPYIY